MPYIIGFGGNALVYGGNYLGVPYPVSSLPPKHMHILFTDPSVDMNDNHWASWWRRYTGTVVWTQLSSEPNLWDFYYDQDWSGVMHGDYMHPDNPFTGSTIHTGYDAAGIPGTMQILDANLEGVTTLSGAFLDNGKLTVANLRNTTTVTNLDNCFNDAANLTDVPIFDTRNVTIFARMFWGCAALTAVPFYDTSAGTVMAGMFHGCRGLTSIPLFDTRRVTTMSSMLMYCSGLTSVPLFDTSSVTNMESMLSGCTSLTEVPAFNTANVTNMRTFCYGCSSLTRVPLLSTKRVQWIREAFEECRNVEDGALALYNQMISQQTPPTVYSGCFANCGVDTQTGLQQLRQIPSAWGGMGN